MTAATVIQKQLEVREGKCITKAKTIQKNHCWHTHVKWGFHCHKNAHCSLWKEYSWGHNYNIWCCINKIPKSTLLIWIGNPSSQSMMEAYMEKKENPPSYRCIIFLPNPMLFRGFPQKTFSGFWRSPLSPFTNWEFVWASLNRK